jgi:hypothetical protein
MITSFGPVHMDRKPSSSTTATSPVRSHPSGELRRRGGFGSFQ